MVTCGGTQNECPRHRYSSDILLKDEWSTGQLHVYVPTCVYTARVRCGWAGVTGKNVRTATLYTPDTATHCPLLVDGDGFSCSRNEIYIYIHTYYYCYYYYRRIIRVVYCYILLVVFVVTNHVAATVGRLGRSLSAV